MLPAPDPVTPPDTESGMPARTLMKEIDCPVVFVHCTERPVPPGVDVHL
ncbi:hypothetical protein AB0D42_04585 [Streptomyces sp. NPDC048304]|jgi:hypothetical protein